MPASNSAGMRAHKTLNAEYDFSTLIAVFTWNLEKIYIPPDGKGGSDGIVRQKAVPEYGKGARNPDY